MFSSDLDKLRLVMITTECLVKVWQAISCYRILERHQRKQKENRRKERKGKNETKEKIRKRK
jgi:hypothetical protein